MELNKEQSILERMRALGVREEDIEERFIRAQGPGGQNVNKVSTCVQLKHIPSGIEVKCQQERSQAQNRLRAREILCDKFEASMRRKRAEEKSRIEKIRRQKRKRSYQAKVRMLEAKRLHSRKKMLRWRVNVE
jgi:peptide chain release factor